MVSPTAKSDEHRHDPDRGRGVGRVDVLATDRHDDPARESDGDRDATPDSGRLPDEPGGQQHRGLVAPVDFERPECIASELEREEREHAPHHRRREESGIGCHLARRAEEPAENREREQAREDKRSILPGRRADNNDNGAGAQRHELGPASHDGNSFRMAGPACVTILSCRRALFRRSRRLVLDGRGPLDLGAGHRVADREDEALGHGVGASVGPDPVESQRHVRAPRAR